MSGYGTPPREETLKSKALRIKLFWILDFLYFVLGVIVGATVL